MSEEPSEEPAADADADAEPVPEPTPNEPPHTPQEALALLVVSLLLFFAVGFIPPHAGTVLGDLAPPLRFLALVLPAYLLVTRSKRDPFQAHALWGVPVRHLLQATLVSLVVLGLYVAVFALYQGGGPRHAIEWREVGIQLVWGFFFYALAEEYLFRGVLQPSLENEGGPWFRLLGAPYGQGAVLAAALFAVAHLYDPRAGVNPARLAVFFPALWFGWVRARTGSILPAAVAHALANAVQLACYQGWRPY